MQTTLPAVFACGHAVSVPHAVTRKPVWLPHAATATRTAQIAGRNAAAREGERTESLSAVAGTALVKVGDKYFARTGLTDQEAKQFFGDDRVATMTVQGFTAEPWLDADALCVRVIVAKNGPDPARAVVVGGEAFGKTGVPRRIDVLASAVLEGWSPWRLADLDIAYAAALGPAPDPVNLSGALAGLSLSGEAQPVDAFALRAELAGPTPPVIVDVGRPSGEAAPWPTGALRVPLEELRDRIDELPRDRPLVVVSRTGQRSFAGYRVLVQRGFADVRFLDGGALSYALTS
jgi:rhodanese-related sulfurtransferase